MAVDLRKQIKDINRSPPGSKKNEPCSSAHPLRISTRFRPCKSHPQADVATCISSMYHQKINFSISQTQSVNTHLMPYRLEPALHILQAELAYPQPPIRDRRILFRKRGIIPRLDVIRPEPDRSYSKDPRFEFRSLEWP